MANGEQIYKKQLRVGDIITNDIIESWHQGDIITISAGTGKGKSYFIKNILFSYAKTEDKKILMLIHRSNCVEQFKEEIKRDGKEKYINIMTYQSIEVNELHEYNVDMSLYKYIVCDEFHYFLNDASFNKTTDISFDKILEQNHAIRIFMSATGEDIKKYINLIRNVKTINYIVPLDFSFIKKLTFFNKDSTLDMFMDNAIRKKEKAIFFIQSAEKAYKLYKKYEKYSFFNCSRNNDGYYKHVDKGKISNMLTNEKFDDLVLITTSCMDAGVNIWDDKLKHIVIDIKDIGSLIQCIGRKRLMKDEKIYVYIKTINNQQLGGIETHAKKIIEKADYLKNHSTKEYLDKYPRSYDESNIVYDDISVIDGMVEGNVCMKKINQLMYFKRKFDISQYQVMRLKWGKFGYCKYIANLFGFYDKVDDKFNYRLIEEDNSLKKYLNNMVGNEMLQLKDRKELIEKVNIRHNGKLIKKLETINPALQELGYPYKIRQYETSRIIDGKKKNFSSVWVVERITEDEVAS